MPEKRKDTPQCVLILDPLSHTHAITRSHQVRELRVGSCLASPQQAKEAMPRRLTNPKAEVAGLSSGAEEVAKAGIDEYAREAELCDL